jgi:predicted DNA-binding transcriptional regulator AlpA
MSDTDRVAYSITRACELTGISRAFFYSELKRGRGPRTIKIGKRRLVLHESLMAYLREREGHNGQ